MNRMRKTSKRMATNMKRGSRSRFMRLTVIGASVPVAMLLAAHITASATTPLFLLSALPPIPTAGEPVVMVVTPLNFSATSTTFQWFRNGTLIAGVSGLGRSTTTIATDPSGPQTLQIRVRVNPGPGFNQGEQTITVLTAPDFTPEAGAVEAIASDFSLEPSTRSPDPGQPITIEVVTFSFDKEQATYQWYVNGALDRLASGRARWRLSLPGSADGAVRNIRADVTTSSGQIRSKTVDIQTISIPLYWWTDAVVPYWYRGKALPSTGARVSVMTLPGGRDAGRLTYQWQMNDSVVPQASGTGRQVFTFRMDFPVRERIGVTVGDGAGLEKTTLITVEPVPPRLGIYEVRPLRGTVFEQRLDEFNAPAGDTYDFLAAPFFFPLNRMPSLVYHWLLNGNKITGAFDEPQRFTLQSQAGEVSTSRLNVAVEDPTRGGGKTFGTVYVNLR